MAYLIEKLILITDKEYFQDYINHRNYDNSRRKILFIIVFIINLNNTIKAKIFRYTCKLLQNKNYKLGLHFGNNFEYAESDLIKNIDFAMCPENIKSKAKKDLHLTSRDFINKNYLLFGEKYNNKSIDFICVANNSKNKNLATFLSKLIENKYKGSGIFIVPKHNYEKKNTHDINLVQLYESANREFKNSVSMIRVSEELGFQGLQGPAIPLMMACSKVLVLPSDSEGEPRVVTEAIVSGAKVLLPEWQKNNLPEKYSKYIKKFESFDKLIDLLSNLEWVYCNNSEFNCNFNNNINKFSEFIFNEFGMKINISENYDRVLPGHINMDLPWSDKKIPNNYPNIEIITYKQLIEFYKYYYYAR